MAIDTESLDAQTTLFDQEPDDDDGQAWWEAMDATLRAERRAVEVEFWRRLQVPDRWRNPSVQDFVRHVQRFGPDFVVGPGGRPRRWMRPCAYFMLSESEVADLEVEVLLLDDKPTGKPQRRTTPKLRSHVEALAKRGLMTAAIADTLNISDRRVKQILSEQGNPGNGA